MVSGPTRPPTAKYGFEPDQKFKSFAPRLPKQTGPGGESPGPYESPLSCKFSAKLPAK